MKVLAAAAAAAVGCLLALVLVVAVLLSGGGEVLDMAAAACAPPGPAVQPAAHVSGVPGGSVAGYSGDQLAAAAQIMRAGADAGFGVRGQTIGVMTAMGESGLRPLTYGDAAGPNSRGYFQQRDWGPVADELDPYKSATMFYRGGRHGEPGATSVPGWEQMAPTLAAHAVQRNADPYFYTKFWNPAVAVVQALAGTSVQVTGVAPGTGGQACTGTPPGQQPPTQVGAGGWTNPAPGTRLTSGFSAAPVNRSGVGVGVHLGVDLAAPLGTPIYAAAAGTVISSGPASGFGHWIRIDHGGGVITVYGHMYAEGLLVHVGDPVRAGQQIARMGADGQATGPHLHLEVRTNGTAVDPVSFFALRGVHLGGTPL